MHQYRLPAILAGALALVVVAMLLWTADADRSSVTLQAAGPLESDAPIYPGPDALQPSTGPAIIGQSRPARKDPAPYPEPSASPQASPVPTVQRSASLPRPSPSLDPRTREPRPSSTTTTVTDLPLIFKRLVLRAPTATASPTATPSPTATATPTPPWPEPLATPGPSKLGLHVQWNNSPDILEFISRYKPAVVKGVGDLSIMEQVKELSPTTITVGRLEDNTLPNVDDPRQAAQRFVAERLPAYQAYPWVDYWEGVNEPDLRRGMAWYAAFEAERARLMAEQGFRVAVGGFSAGVPEWEDMAAFAPALEAAQQYGGILTLHEYDAPTLTRAVGAPLPGQPAHEDRGALMLRYRWWYEDLMLPRGLAIPLVISEAGIDGLVENRHGPDGQGWKDFAGYWAANGLGNDAVATYLKQLAWYDAELQQDDYVIGCAIFTVGAMSEQWETYDITGILRQVGAYLVEQARTGGVAAQ